MRTLILLIACMLMVPTALALSKDSIIVPKSRTPSEYVAIGTTHGVSGPQHPTCFNQVAPAEVHLSASSGARGPVNWSLHYVLETPCGSFADACTGPQIGASVSGSCTLGGAFQIENLARTNTTIAFDLALHGRLGPFSYSASGSFSGVGQEGSSGGNPVSAVE